MSLGIFQAAEFPADVCRLFLESCMSSCRNTFLLLKKKKSGNCPWLWWWRGAGLRTRWPSLSLWKRAFEGKWRAIVAGAQWASLKWTRLSMESMMMGFGGMWKFFEKVKEFFSAWGDTFIRPAAVNVWTAGGCTASQVLRLFLGKAGTLGSEGGVKGESPLTGSSTDAANVCPFVGTSVQDVETHTATGTEFDTRTSIAPSFSSVHHFIPSAEHKDVPPPVTQQTTPSIFGIIIVFSIFFVMMHKCPPVSHPLICSNTTWHSSGMTSLPVDRQSEKHSGVDCVLVMLPHNLTRRWTQTTAVVFYRCRGEARWRLKAAQPRQSTAGSPSSPLSLLSNTQEKTGKKHLLYYLFSFPFILAANLSWLCLSRHRREAPLAERQTDRQQCDGRSQSAARLLFKERRDR